MRNNKTNYAWVGGFVLLAFGTLLTALYLLGGNRGPTHTYYTELRNVAGIKFGTPVTYAGYPLGQKMLPDTEKAAECQHEVEPSGYSRSQRTARCWTFANREQGGNSQR